MSWKVSNNKLVNEIRFKTQLELANYITKVARIADQHDHHPDFKVTKCSYLTLELYNHESNSISDKDYQLAELIDLIPIPKNENVLNSTWDL